MPCTSEFGAGVGAPSTGAARSRRRRPAPETVSGPGAPTSSACAARRSRTRCATLPAPPAAATSPHNSAAAPPTYGVAQDVPPQALTSSDSGSPGVISTFVGAEMSGLRRPSSVGPSDEYDSGRSVVASKAPTEKRAGRVAGRGRARGRDLRRRREIHAAVERQVRRRRVADAPHRHVVGTGGGDRSRRHVGVRVGERARARGTGSADACSCRGRRRQRRVGVEREGVVARRIGGGARPGEVAGGAAGRRQLHVEGVARRPARRGCRRRRRRSTGPPSAACGSCPPS